MRENNVKPQLHLPRFRKPIVIINKFALLIPNFRNTIMPPIFPMRQPPFFGLLDPHFHPVFVQGIVLSEILNDERVSESLGYVSDPKKEELLCSEGVGVGAHVEVVEAVGDFDDCGEVAGFEVTVELERGGEVWFVWSRGFDEGGEDLVFCEDSVVDLLV